MSENHEVGDVYELEGHCMVAYPDGTVVTASGSFRFSEPGEFRVIYAEDDMETVVVTDGAGTEPSLVMDADPAHAASADVTGSLSDDDAPEGESDGDDLKSAATGEIASVGTEDDDD